MLKAAVKNISKKIAEKQRIAEKKEKELKESGEPIDYGQFYAKSKTGMTYGKRYRFYACLPQSGCIMNPDIIVNQNVCGVEPQFDDQEEYESWLSSGKKILRKYCCKYDATSIWWNYCYP